MTCQPPVASGSNSQGGRCSGRDGGGCRFSKRQSQRGGSCLRRAGMPGQRGGGRAGSFGPPGRTAARRGFDGGAGGRSGHQARVGPRARAGGGRFFSSVSSSAVQSGKTNRRATTRRFSKKSRRVTSRSRSWRHRPCRQSSTEWKAKASRLITASRLARPSDPWPKLCLLFRYRNNEEYFLGGGAADGGRL